MSTIHETIEVDVPLSVAYNQWTQFEEFPRFMEGVEEVQQRDNSHLHWRAKIGGVEREWDARIVEQEPDVRVSWETIAGATNTGSVQFHEIGSRKCEVDLTLEFEPDGFVEKAADMLHLVQTRTRSDLERFKEFIESRQKETGAWRGEIHEQN